MIDDADEIARLVREQTAAIEQFKSRYDRRHEDHVRRMDDFERRMNRPGAGAGGGLGGDDEYKNSFLGFLRSGRTAGVEAKAMATDSGPAGGYLVPTEIDDAVSRVLREFSPMRQVARVIPVSSGEFSMLHSVGGTGTSWAGEREARPETDSPDFQEIKPPMGEIYANPKVSQRLLDDSVFDLEGWLIDELAEAFAAGEGSAWISGTGINRPRGILTYDISSSADGTRADDDLQYVASGASGAFAGSNPADKLVKLVHALKPAYRKGAVWLLNTNTLEQVRIMKDGQGNYIWRAGIEKGEADRLLGYPVYEDENMPDIEANSLSIAFGNFQRGYVITDRNSGMLRDPYTAKPHVCFYTTRRVGGCVRDTRAIKLMKFAAS
ncbi:MAG: phage major capsid protein [Burkholderiales bacterium]|nr:phage major capsid protein [Burkholderiales bacterium]